jgi:asparagine synthase (glutamine-hydrolysing)
MKRFIGNARADGINDIIGEPPFRIGSLEICFTGYIANPAEVPPFPNAEPLTEEMRFARSFAMSYVAWGLDLSRHVFGEYAAAIYDSSERLLLLAHDTLDILPLYYSEQKDAIMFASHLDALVGGGCPLSLDEEYIADYLCYGDHYGDRTPFSMIKRLPPGVAIVYRNGKVKMHRCWSITNPKSIRYSDTRDYADHFQALVTSAVKAAVPVSGTTWCELSGGLDSSTVSCTLARIRPSRPVSSLSYIYSESRRADESRWIRAVTEQYGLESYTVNGDVVRPFSELPAYFCAQPSHAMINAALHRACASVLSQNRVDVLLTGMGGDAVLFGDGPEPFYLADLLCRGRLIALARGMRIWSDGSKEGRPVRYWLARCAFTAAFRRFRHHLIQDHPPKISWLSSTYTDGRSRNGKRRRTWVPGAAGVADSWFLERVLRSANVVSGWEFVASTGAEFRHPLMYLPLVEFMRSIPWEMKFSPASDRALHRIAFADILPRVVAERVTKGGPDQAIYAGLDEDGPWLPLIGEAPYVCARGYLDSVRWRETIELARVGRCESVKHFKAAASLEVWLRQIEAPLPKAISAGVAR